MTIPGPEVFSDLTELGLQDLEMAANTRAANLRKSIIKEIDLWIENREVASIARWMIMWRRSVAARASKRDVDIGPRDGGLLPE